MKRTNIILTIIIAISILILALLLAITYNNIQTYNSSTVFLKSMLDFTSNNNEEIFTIDKITFFSSSDAEISTNSNSVFTISNLYQFTDIALFISPVKEDFTQKNTIKSVQIEQIKFSTMPDIGTPNLYYKNINNFSTPKYEKENLITDSLTFETTSENTLDYSKPILYNNLANPITLCYVNSGIKKNHTLFNNVSNISHNGTLLKTCGITLNSITCKIDFIVKAINNLDEEYICPISLNIPLSTEESTIYDGNLIVKDNVSYRFIKQ